MDLLCFWPRTNITRENLYLAAFTGKVICAYVSAEETEFTLTFYDLTIPNRNFWSKWWVRHLPTASSSLEFERYASGRVYCWPARDVGEENKK
jgi:hypothetical protein